jgi:hypothetical protein
MPGTGENQGGYFRKPFRADNDIYNDIYIDTSDLQTIFCAVVK